MKGRRVNFFQIDVFRVDVISKLLSHGVIANPSFPVILSEAKNLPNLLRVNSVKQSHEIAASLRSSQ